MKHRTNQTLILISIGLITIGAVLILTALNTPRVYSENDVVTAPTATTETTVSYPLNINTATVEELMTIKEIGEVKAKSIVAYRNKIGSYKSLDQLCNISGINENILSKIEPYLTV